MNTPSPLVPEGAISPAKGKSNIKIAVFTILAIHAVLLGGMLIQGCKPGAKPEAKAEPAPASGFEPISSAPEAAQSVIPTDASVPAPAPTPDYAPVAAAPAPAVVPTAAVPTAAVPVAAVPTTVIAAPVAVSEPVVAPLGEMQTHVVAKGEMLSTIAQKYRVSVKAIQDANPSVNPMKLQIKQTLNIPAPMAKTETAALSAPVDAGVRETGAAGTYKVKPGDALEKIARNNKTTVKAIKALNGMKTDRITVGQVLKLPAKSSAANEAPTSDVIRTASR